MGEFSIGQSVRRREDPRLLMGRGRYFDDLKLADQFHAAIVRSPHAHADIKSIDSRAALQMPGVHAVLTGKDYEADGLGTNGECLQHMAPALDAAIHKHVDAVAHGIDDFGQLVE